MKQTMRAMTVFVFVVAIGLSSCKKKQDKTNEAVDFSNNNGAVDPQFNAVDGQTTDQLANNLGTQQQVQGVDESIRNDSKLAAGSGDQSAAIAAPNVEDQSKEDSNANGSLADLGSSLNGSGSGNGRKGSGAGFGVNGASGSGSGLLGDVRTGVLEDPSLKDKNTGKFGLGGDGSGSEAGKGGLYTAGGGGGRSSDSGYGDGSGEVGVSSRGHSVKDIERDPASLSADGSSGADGADGMKEGMRGRDPDNYFALLGPDDNIFKIVERRYTTKSQQWAISDVKAVKLDVRETIRK